MSETIGVGILGLGVVGSGVIKMIMENKESLYQKTGNHLSIERILVQDKAKERDIEIDSEVLTTDANDVLNHADIDIIIEVIGGVEEAKLHIQQALRNKKHVVTANKDLIALYGPELHQLAKQNGCDLLYEASVGGGIPIIRGLNDGLAAD